MSVSSSMSNPMSSSDTALPFARLGIGDRTGCGSGHVERRRSPHGSRNCSSNSSTPRSRPCSRRRLISRRIAAWRPRPSSGSSALRTFTVPVFSLCSPRPPAVAPQEPLLTPAVIVAASRVQRLCVSSPLSSSLQTCYPSIVLRGIALGQSVHRGSLAWSRGRRRDAACRPPRSRSAASHCVSGFSGPTPDPVLRATRRPRAPPRPRPASSFMSSVITGAP